MALQSDVGKIYALFHACLPDDERVSYTLNMQKITVSKDYRTLAATKSGSALVTNGAYSVSELAKCTASELDEIIKALPLALKFLQTLERVLKVGDTALLTEAMRPDFRSTTSLTKSIKSLESVLQSSDAKAVNYTNISETDILTVFDPQTIRVVDTLMETETQETVSLLPKGLDKVFPGKRYCINSARIVAIQNNMADALSKINGIHAKAAYQKSELRRYKLVATGIYALSLIGAMSSDWDVLQGGAFALLPGIALLLLWIKG